MRSIVAVLLFLLSLVSLTSVSALKIGTVRTNNQVIAVTSVDSALIAVGVGAIASNAAGVARYNDPTNKNTISIDFRRGSGGSNFGFYPNTLGAALTDKFYYRQLLTLVNKSGQAQCVAVYVTSGTPGDLAEIQVRKASDPAGIIGSGPKTWASSPSAGRTGCVLMPVGTQIYAVDFLWAIKTTAPATAVTKGFTVSVEARPVTW